MKRLLILGVSWLVMGIPTLSSQTVQLPNLFDAGLNMGYLLTHWQNRTASTQLESFAQNAEREWAASWSDGTLPNIRVDRQSPSTSEKKFRNLLVSLPTAGCENRWYRAKEPVYEAGAQLGTALVESRSSCSQCLSLALQKAGLALRQIATLTSQTRVQELSFQLDNMGKSLRENLDPASAKKQNSRHTASIEAAIDELKFRILPTSSQSCSEGAPVAEGPDPRAPNAKSTRKRQLVVKAGGNVTTFTNTQDASQTEVAPGFEAGLQLIRGKRIYLGLGASYFQYSTGEELTDRFPVGEKPDYERFYISGFKVPLFLGLAPVNRNKVKFRLHGGGNIYTSTSMIHTFTSMGDLAFQDPHFTYMAGAQFVYGVLVVDVTYENGVTETLLSNSDGYLLTNLALSAGFNF